jgi:hypothetical protein
VSARQLRPVAVVLLQHVADVHEPLRPGQIFVVGDDRLVGQILFAVEGAGLLVRVAVTDGLEERGSPDNTSEYVIKFLK